MYKRYNNKGITLIALVITIIVLLILAGVSIGMLTGDNSILTNASKARKESALSSVKEQVLMAINTAYTEYHAKEVTKTLAEGESLYDDTKAALVGITSNNSEVSYVLDATTDPNIVTVTITYLKDGTVITGKLLKTTEAFNWD